MDGLWHTLKELWGTATPARELSNPTLRTCVDLLLTSVGSKARFSTLLVPSVSDKARTADHKTEDISSQGFVKSSELLRIFSG